MIYLIWNFCTAQKCKIDGGELKEDRDKIALLTKIARLYYEDGKTQEEIGELLGLSRFKVLRLLKEAHKLGIVSIRIVDITSTCEDLEEEIEKKFGLKRAIVVPNGGFPKSIVIQEIGRWGSTLLQNIVQHGDVIGVGWGATVSECVRSLNDDYKDVKIVPLGGGTGQIEPKYQVNELSKKLAGKLKAKWYSLDIPIFVEDGDIKKLLLNEPRIREILSLWGKLTVAIVGIGNISGLWEDRSPLSAFSKEAIEILKEELTLYKTVGDIVQNFFDINGKISPISIRENIISISIEELKRVNSVIALSGWEDKKEAILGALRSGYITHLVTDESVAEYLVKENCLSKAGEVRDKNF